MYYDNMNKEDLIENLRTFYEYVISNSTEIHPGYITFDTFKKMYIDDVTADMIKSGKAYPGYGFSVIRWKYGGECMSYPTESRRNKRIVYLPSYIFPLTLQKLGKFNKIKVSEWRERGIELFNILNSDK